MKRALFLLLFAVLTVMCSYAQNSVSDYVENYDYPNFYNSKYYKCSENHFLSANTTIDASLRFERENVRLSDSQIMGTLQIKADPELVYDCSKKVYETEYDNYSIEYTIYANADKLAICYAGKTYSLDCINGSCDAHIKNLSREYIPNEEGETLVLSVTNDFPLTARNGDIVIVKKGSCFTFEVFD